MRLHIDWELKSYWIRKQAMVVIVRGKKNRIIYNSGLNYFYYTQAMEAFVRKLKNNPNVECHTVDILQAHQPPIEESSKGYWCPYCQNWEYWIADAGGYKRCPICGISDNDFYVKSYNKIWHLGMKSKKAKLDSEKVSKKSKKWRKRKESLE